MNPPSFSLADKGSSHHPKKWGDQVTNDNAIVHHFRVTLHRPPSFRPAPLSQAISLYNHHTNEREREREPKLPIKGIPYCISSYKLQSVPHDPSPFFSNIRNISPHTITLIKRTYILPFPASLCLPCVAETTSSSRITFCFLSYSITLHR